MNSNQVLVDKKLINFAIRHVLNSFMLNEQMGTYNSFLKIYEFSDEEYEKVKQLIKDKELPCGYYTLCDLIGEDY